MTPFETTNSVFIINQKNKKFSTSTTSYWTPEDGEEIINKLNKLIKLRSENDIGLHVKDFEKRGTRIEKKTVDKIKQVLITLKVKYLQK